MDVVAEVPAVIVDDGLPNKVAQLLVQHRSATLQKLEELAKVTNSSERNYLRTLHAVCENSLVTQEAVLSGVCRYLELQKQSPDFTVPLVLHKLKYDETPLKVRAQYGDGDLHEHTARVYVIQEEWIMLCRSRCETSSNQMTPRWNYLTLRGALSPQMRVAQNGTGDACAEMLQQTLVVPKHARGLAERTWKLIETDECGSNIRCEKVMQQPGVVNCHLFCSAHKAHQVCQVTWSHFKTTHAGAVQTLKTLKKPGMLQRFMDKFLQLIDQSDLLVVRTAPLSEEDKMYRRTVLRLFAPLPHESRKANASIAFIAETLLNGNWRVPHVLEHRCGPSCCQNRRETVEKVKHAVRKMVSWLRVTKLETKNWLYWHQHLFFVGFWSLCHNMFSLVFLKAFSGVAIEAQPSQWSVWRAMIGTDAPEDEAVRDQGGEDRELAQMLKVATQWLKDPNSPTMLYVLRLALVVQTKLMSEMIACTNSTWDLAQAMDATGVLRDLWMGRCHVSGDVPFGGEVA